MSLSDRRDVDAGSRMHVLDWVESEDFLSSVRNMVMPIGFTVTDNAVWQPKGRHDHHETVLVGGGQRFLSRVEEELLVTWWLVHRKGAKLPTWDLVVSALDSHGKKALILVEAKAHATELSSAGKLPARRKTPEEQARSDANHARIFQAILEAKTALQQVVPTIAICQGRNYQFANRIAFAWKLASMGIPVALIYLGFIGDTAIARPGMCFLAPADWQAAFQRHTANDFPIAMEGRKVDCGAAAFWLLVKDHNVSRLSPPVDQRRSLARPARAAGP
jgi:hypothetical protein